jgi:hypothetical protein
VIGNAIKVAKIATGRETEEFEGAAGEEFRSDRTGPQGRAEARRYHVSGTAGGDRQEGRRQAAVG